MTKPFRTLELDFDSRILIAIFGEQDKNLKNLARVLEIEIFTKGNKVIMAGPDEKLAMARQILDHAYAMVKSGKTPTEADFQGFIRLVTGIGETDESASSKSADGISTRKMMVRPRTPGQAEYIQALRDYELVFGVGPAGTGKTYLAVAMGVSLLLEKKVERLILSRPAVEAGEQLGFLPGDLREKVDPYLRPLYDALHDMMPRDQVEAKLKSGEIEIAPLAFMRGRTLAHAYVILDEAQNTVSSQMKMFLTRIGEGSRMVITGDLSQVDLPKGKVSGLREAHVILRDVKQLKFCFLTRDDVVRHPLITAIVDAYDDHDSDNPYEEIDKV